MESFTVDLDELDHVVTRLTALGRILSEELVNIDSLVAQLHSTSWSGVAAQAHAEAHAQWATAATTFNDGVAEMRGVARHAHEQYTTAQSTNLRMLH